MAGQALRQCMHDVNAYLILLIAVATLGPLVYGYHLAELNAPQDVITCRRKSISTLGRVSSWLTSAEDDAGTGVFPDCIPMNEAAFATISSSFMIGGLIGALCSGPFSSRTGRLPPMRITALLYIIGGGVESMAGSVWLMALGRGICGLGAGASTVIVPLYISEVAPPKERGTFGVMTQVSICVGILLAQTCGYFLSYGNLWRVILGIAACIGVLNALGLIIIPESPAWTAANRSKADATRILQRIRGKGFDISEEVSLWGSEEESDGERQGLLAQSEDEVSPTAPTKQETAHLGFFQVAKDPMYRPALVAVVGLMFAQQFCGINSIIMYSVSLLANLLPISSALLTILVSVVNLITTILCAPLPDRLGRKTCLLISIIGQGVSSLTLAISIAVGAKVLSALAVVFFVGFFAVGLGPVPFMIAAELVGQEAVGATQSWCLAGSYVATFIVAQYFPIVNAALNKALGGSGWVYYIFAALAGLFAIFVAWRVPETKGKKDADEVWGRTRRID